MGFLPVFYAGVFFLIACCVGNLFAQYEIAPLQEARVLGEAGIRYLLLYWFFPDCFHSGFSTLRGTSLRREISVVYGIAYVIPGFVGGWLSLKILESFRS